MFHVYTVILAFLTAVFCFTIIHSSAFKCSYVSPGENEVMYSSANGSSQKGNRLRRAGRKENLRFKAFFHESILKMKDQSTKSYIVNQLIPEAIEFWSKVLSLKPWFQQSHVRFSRKCSPSDPNDRETVMNDGTHKFCKFACVPSQCGEIRIPDEHSDGCSKLSTGEGSNILQFAAGTGVDADFVLYVSSVPNPRCESPDTIAYAAHCLLDRYSSRPVVGHTNLCPRSVEAEYRNHELLLSTVKHEMVHALGFSSGLFKYFRDSTGRILPLSDVIQSVIINDWYTPTGPISRTVTYVKTPLVQEFVRKHFNCSDLIGAELENQGSEGTAGTHWEKRLFENEAMAGTHTQIPAYSKLTFAILEDTGWYSVDYSYADLLHWGKNLGCDFAQKICAFWIANRRKQCIYSGKNQLLLFVLNCSTVKSKALNGSKTTCTLMRSSVAICNLEEYDKPLPSAYQVFDSLAGVRKEADMRRFGGSVELADFCPYLQEFDLKDTKGNRLRDSRCELAENQPPRSENIVMEEYMSNSRCFMHGEKGWTARRCQLVRASFSSTAGCHQVMIACTFNHICAKTAVMLESSNHLVKDQFECKLNLIWLVMDNGTIKYPCYHEGQRIQVRRVWKGWAHQGIVICPSCELLCHSEKSSFKCASPRSPPEEIGDFSVRIPCRGFTVNGFPTLLTCHLVLLNVIHFLEISSV